MARSGDQGDKVAVQEGKLLTFTHPDLGPKDVSAQLIGTGFDLRPPQISRRSLLDTFDGRLHAVGLRLEFDDGNRGELILSERNSPPAHAAVGAAPKCIADLPDGPFRARLAPVVEVRALLPMLTVTERRSAAVRRNANGKTQVAVVLHDHIEVDRPAPAMPAWVVELQEFEGYATAAGEARGLLASLGLALCDGDVLGLAAAAAGVNLNGHDASPTVPLEPGEAAIDGFRRVLTKLADAIDANLAGTADDVDPEFLHDLRVAVRRSRAVLTQAKGVLPSQLRKSLRSEFGWLGAATGPARDLDVFVIEWPGYVAALGPERAALLEPVLAHLTSRRDGEHATLTAILQSDRYRQFFGGWRAWLTAGSDGAKAPRDSHRRLGPVVADRVADSQQHLLTSGRRIGPLSPSEELHALRKDAKKLRYLLECFGGVVAAKPRKAFVQRLKALQDNLGEHQDAEVHAAGLLAMSRQLHQSGETSPETLLAVGGLIAHLERRRQRARNDFAQHFAAYDTKQTDQTLKKLLRSAVRG